MPADNKTRYAILGVLSIMPGSGYDIKKFCDQGISMFWNENFGHIYPMLRRMELDGAIEKVTGATSGYPPRTVYAITAKGREELIAWLARPVDHSPARLELLLKLTFAKHIPKETMIAELERVRDRHMAMLQACQRSERELMAKPAAVADPGYPYWLATVRYGIGDAGFRVQWCQQTIDSLRGLDAEKMGDE